MGHNVLNSGRVAVAFKCSFGHNFHDYERCKGGVWFCYGLSAGSDGGSGLR